MYNLYTIICVFQMLLMHKRGIAHMSKELSGNTNESQKKSTYPQPKQPVPLPTPVNSQPKEDTIKKQLDRAEQRVEIDARKIQDIVKQGQSTENAQYWKKQKMDRLKELEELQRVQVEKLKRLVQQDLLSKQEKKSAGTPPPMPTEDPKPSQPPASYPSNQQGSPGYNQPAYTQSVPESRYPPPQDPVQHSLEHSQPVGPAGDHYPTGPASDRHPVHAANDQLPVGPANDRLPLGHSSDHYPVDPARDRLPVGPASDRYPVDAAIDRLPVGPASDRYPVDAARDRLPVGPASDRYPVDAARDRLPVGPASDRYPVDPARDRLPVGPTSDRYPPIRERYPPVEPASRIEHAGRHPRPSALRRPVVDPYADDPYANDPYANDPYANDPYANDPYAKDPYARPYPYGRPPPRRAANIDYEDNLEDDDYEYDNTSRDTIPPQILPPKRQSRVDAYVTSTGSTPAAYNKPSEAKPAASSTSGKGKGTIHYFLI